MADKRMTESTTAEEPSPGVPRARPAAEPAPTKATKAAKAAKTTKAAKTAKPPAKASKTTKATKATKTAKSAKAAQAAEPAKITETTSTTTPAVPPGAWAAALREALAQPDQPPARLAELAVAELGPRAAGWASWLRDTYADPPAHGMARLATHEARQAAWALAAVEAGGPVASIMSLPAVAWVRATLILRIAAAYGHHPAHPDRASELLHLLDLVPGDGELPVLLTAVRGHHSRLAGMVAARIGVRRTPLLAGLRMLIAGGGLSDQLDRLAHRAAAHYRSRSQPPP